MKISRFAITAVCTLALAGAGALSPSPTQAAVFTVDTRLDAVDLNPGDGLCTTEAGTCSLRAAIMEANALAGEDEIVFDPGIPQSGAIELELEALEGPDEGFDDTQDPPVATANPNAAEGDLDITDSLRITGLDFEDVGPVVVVWAETATTPDRIFHVEAVAADVTVSLSDLVLGDGQVGEIDIEDGVDATTDFVLVRRGGAVALGAGAVVVDRNAASGEPGDEGDAPVDGEEGFAITSAVLSRVVVFGSSAAGDGGGIYNGAGLLGLSQSLITGNDSAANGGGLYNDSEAVIEDTTIGALGVETILPPGISEDDRQSLTGGNSAENGGGMFDTGSHQTTLRRSAVNRNTAIGGGGIAARSGVTLVVENSTVSGNSATDVGGGITTNGTVRLTNATVVDNSASTDAPGGGAGLNSFGGGTYTFVNSIIANNNKTGEETQTLSNCGCSGGEVTCPAGVLTSDGGNIADDQSCALDETSDQLSTDPLILALTNVDPVSGVVALTEFHPLQQGLSPAIDAGEDGACPATDQRGAPRPADGNLDGTAICDVGSYELVDERAPADDNDDDDGLFGCTLNPGGGFDPLLPAVLLSSLAGLGLRRRLQRG